MNINLYVQFWPYLVENGYGRAPDNAKTNNGLLHIADELRLRDPFAAYAVSTKINTIWLHRES